MGISEWVLGEIQLWGIMLRVQPVGCAETHPDGWNAWHGHVTVDQLKEQKADFEQKDSAC